MNSVVRHARERVESFAAAILRAHGVPADHAGIAAVRLADADARGRGAHGLAQLPIYCQRIDAGGVNATPTITVEPQSPVSALIDADDALGQVAMTRAVEVAADKAADAGLAWVGVRRSNHAGAGGVYASMLARRDLVGIYAAVGSANLVAPTGGLDALLGPNPLAVGIPALTAPVVLDISTTVTSMGRVHQTAAAGEALPPGWMMDRDGQPLTDPARVAEGLLLPLGGHKGYGLALVLGLLAGSLNDAAFGDEVVNYRARPEATTNTGQLLIALRPDLLRDVDDFKAANERYLQQLRDATPIDADEPVRIPGEAGERRADRSWTEGLALPAGTVAELDALAARCGMDDALSDGAG